MSEQEILIVPQHFTCGICTEMFKTETAHVPEGVTNEELQRICTGDHESYSILCTACMSYYREMQGLETSATCSQLN